MRQTIANPVFMVSIRMEQIVIQIQPFKWWPFFVFIIKVLEDFTRLFIHEDDCVTEFEFFAVWRGAAWRRIDKLDRYFRAVSLEVHRTRRGRELHPSFSSRSDVASTSSPSPTRLR